MNSYYGKAQRSKDRATNSAVATILRKGDHSKDLQTRNKRDKGMALAKSRTIKKMRGEATSGEVDYGSDKSVKMIKKVTPNEAQEGKKGLWANIHAKRKRGERMRKKGEKGAPTPAAIKSAQKENAKKFAMADKKAYKDTNTNNAMDMVKANDAQSKKGYKTEKITLAKVRKALYKGAKALGDVQAVRKKRVGKRIVRRAAGKVAGRALGKLFR